MSLETTLTALGLPGIALGTVLEGDGVAFMAGVLAHRGLFAFEAAAGAAALGAVIIDNVIYWVGRRGARASWAQNLMARPGVGVMRARLKGHQTLAILGFRFVWGMKTAGALMIGASGAGWPRFALLDAVAALAWAHLLAALGWGAGAAIVAALGPLHLHFHLALALGLFLLVAGGLWLAWRARRTR